MNYSNAEKLKIGDVVKVTTIYGVYIRGKQFTTDRNSLYVVEYIEAAYRYAGKRIRIIGTDGILFWCYSEDIEFVEQS